MIGTYVQAVLITDIVKNNTSVANIIADPIIGTYLICVCMTVLVYAYIHT